MKGIHRMLKMEEFRKIHIQVLGAEDTYGKNATQGDVRNLSSNIFFFQEKRAKMPRNVFLKFWHVMQWVSWVVP